MNRAASFFRAAVVTAAASALLTAAVSAAGAGVGTVTADGLRMRAQASTDSAVLATASRGDQVVIQEELGEGWFKVDFDSQEGYMSGEFLTVELTAPAVEGVQEGEAAQGSETAQESETPQEDQAGHSCGRVVTDAGTVLNVRSGPGTEYDRLAALHTGTVVAITGEEGDWFQISYGSVTGYVTKEYLLPGTQEELQGDSGLGAQVVEYAKQYLGVPYVWGGNGPNSFDCSGFTRYVYNHFGVSLSRTASGQLQSGTSVNWGEWMPGDLVFFYNGRVSTPVSHVGIYVGDGTFIHASTNAYAVEYDSLYSNWYSNTYVYARRIF